MKITIETKQVGAHWLAYSESHVISVMGASEREVIDGIIKSVFHDPPDSVLSTTYKFHVNKPEEPLVITGGLRKDNWEYAKERLTCFKCVHNGCCEYAWNNYNTNGACLAIK